MFGRTWKVFTVRGIPVQVDTSWIVMAAFFVYAFYNAAMVEQPQLGEAGALAFAVIEAAAFFGSILFHEGAHALVCRVNRIQVRSITLFALGGFTSAHIEEKGPKQEFLVAIVGPLSSLLLAVVFRLAAETGAFGPAVTDSLRTLAFVNMLLGLFNLLPGFPLDGGRVLRSAVWGATRNRAKAARVARWSGQIAGAGLMGFGAWQFFQGGFGLFSIFIGFFLFQAAGQSEDAERVRRLLEGATVADAMGPPPASIPADLSLADALDDYLRGNEHQAFPVVDGGRLAGVLTFAGAARVGQHDPLRPVRDAMTPLDAAKVVEGSVPLGRAIHEIQGGGAALVVDAFGALRGSLSPADVEAWARRRTDPGPPQAPQPPVPPRPDA